MSATATPLVSVIIPTYRRPAALAVALNALVKQTFPPGDFEAIVVDDSGDPGPPPDITVLPFAFTHIRQPHRGATEARNFGAAQSHGTLLVFMDDDIEPAPEALTVLVDRLIRRARVIVLPTLSHCPPDPGEPPVSDPPVDDGVAAVPFTECRTGLLGARREDFESLGGFKDPTGGWPNWDDIDFGYRAHLAGFQIVRCTQARAIHHNASASLAAATDRWFRAAHAAPRLLERYPELLAYLPMFHDKTPIAWAADPSRLMLRKLARHVASSRPTLRALESAELLLRRWWPDIGARRALERWIIGGHLFRGYRRGLQERETAACRST